MLEFTKATFGNVEAANEILTGIDKTEDQIIYQLAHGAIVMEKDAAKGKKMRDEEQLNCQVMFKK